MAIKLNKRERFAVYIALASIGIFVLIQFVVFPYLDKRDRLQRTLQTKNETLQEMLLLKSEYETLQKKTELSKVGFAKREKGFTLFSFLDRLAGETGIKKNITYMKPSTTSQKNSPYKISLIEMKLQAITTEQLGMYLYRVETSRNMVSVRGLSISKTSKPEGFINAVLKFETIET